MDDLNRNSDSLNDRLPNSGMSTSSTDRGLTTPTGTDATLGSTETLRGDSMRATTGTGAADLRDSELNAGDEIGEAVGGISGVLTGAALGSLGGPVGTIIGGIAGAVSGWWAGRAISEAATHASEEDDSIYRSHYDSVASRPANRSYDDVRPAYQIGHLAGRNPDYTGRSFDDVESDLRTGWSSGVSAAHGEWDQVRDYARNAYDRSRASVSSSSLSSASMSGTGTSSDSFSNSTVSNSSLPNSSFSGGGMSGSASNARLNDTLAGGTAAVTPGSTSGSSMSGSSTSSFGGEVRDTADRAWDKTKDVAHDAGNALERAWDKTKDGAERLADRTERAADDMKDRVDGNPASRPGPDATDRRF